MQEDNNFETHSAQKWLSSALQLAQAHRNISPPNPSVGCIIVSTQGQRMGQGWTQGVGGPHAEIMALRDAVENGQSVQGATVYVTLEPCAHQGRTGPCCDALINAGIQKVVATHTDPNPLVAGQGFARLRAAGIVVEVLSPDDPIALAARELNIGFFSRMIRQRPWVRMKIAASLDGKTALPDGQSQWITSEAARIDGHAWRARSCVVLTGIGTVLQDNPRLDVRLVETPRQPHLVVVDSRLETPLDAHLFIAGRRITLYAAAKNDDRTQALKAKGVEVIYRPGQHPDGTPTGKVDLAALLKDLAKGEVNEVHIEAGHKLNGSLLREGLIDELLIYLAPKLLGPGQGMADFAKLTDLSQAPSLTFKSTQMIGPDLRLQALFSGHQQF